jgi:hypothetical protein
MNFLDRLFAIQLHENQTIGGYIIQNYIGSKNNFSLYAVNKNYNKKFAEKCPICQTALEPKKKRDFQLQLKRLCRNPWLPNAPCGNPKCNTKIFGYVSHRPKYRFRMFYKHFELKRKNAIDFAMEQAEQDYEIYRKDYYRAFKNGNMYYTGSWGIK